LPRFARFQTTLLKKAGQGCSQVLHIKDSLYRTRLSPGSKGTPIGAASEHEVQRSEYDRLAGPGFSCDSAEAWLQLQSEVRYQRQILDP
jgi:hypothetical protein